MAESSPLLQALGRARQQISRTWFSRILINKIWIRLSRFSATSAEPSLERKSAAQHQKMPKQRQALIRSASQSFDAMDTSAVRDTVRQRQAQGGGVSPQQHTAHSTHGDTPLLQQLLPAGVVYWILPSGAEVGQKLVSQQAAGTMQQQGQEQGRRKRRLSRHKQHQGQAQGGQLQSPPSASSATAPHSTSATATATASASSGTAQAASPGRGSGSGRPSHAASPGSGSGRPSQAAPVVMVRVPPSAFGKMFVFKQAVDDHMLLAFQEAVQQLCCAPGPR